MSDTDTTPQPDEAQAGANAARTDESFSPVDADALPLASTDINAEGPDA